MPRVKANDAKDLAANAAVDEMEYKPRASAPSNAPYSKTPQLRDDHGRLAEIVINDQIDIVAEYTELEAELELVENAPAQVTREALNKVERFALRAHRLYINAKWALEAMRVDFDVAIGAMRDQAIAALQVEKETGKRSKQITDADVTGRAASMYPDEWREVNERLLKGEQTVKLCDKMSELWSGRRYSLSAMVGGSR
jgi:hypothetical protein